MKRSRMFFALIGILALTAWLGNVRPAAAMPNCSELRGTTCLTSGASINCWSSGGTVSSCTCFCFTTCRWVCAA